MSTKLSDDMEHNAGVIAEDFIDAVRALEAQLERWQAAVERAAHARDQHEADIRDLIAHHREELRRVDTQLERALLDRDYLKAETLRQAREIDRLREEKDPYRDATMALAAARRARRDALEWARDNVLGNKDGGAALLAELAKLGSEGEP